MADKTAAKNDKRVSLLYDLLRDATKRADLKGIFHVLFRGAREGLGAKTGLVVQHNPEKGALEVKVKTQGKYCEHENLFSTERPQVNDLIGLEETLLRKDPQDMFFKGSNRQIVMPVPVNANDNGLMILESENDQDFSRAQLDFLNEFVEQTSVVIRTRSSVESSKRELDCLWDVKRRIVNPADLDVAELNELLGKILQLALARTKSQTGIILMAEEETGDLVTSSQAVMGDVAFNVPEKFTRRKRGRASGIAFWVLDNNKPYMSGDTSSDPNYIPFFKGVKSNISAPISFQDRCIGVIVVESPEPNAFTEQDLKVLEELSKNVTILVRRAQLYEATRGIDKTGRGVLIRGLSSEWEEVERRVERAAATNAIVILRGDSGTGKELVAKSIFFNSKLKDSKLVIVNSAAIPDQLLESALFGHVKGAFTGATYDRVGDFERADGGTIFLDEIGDVGLPLQAKLLRVLESGEIQKIGSNQDSKKVNVRVIAATSRNLEEMMEQREFREDLYYRLHVVPIWLPALKEYKKSIPGMVKAFIREAAANHERPVTGISADALDMLMRHDYPGNVRELKNVIEQSVILARTKTINVDDLPHRLVATLKSQPVGLSSRDFKSMKKQVLDDFEREYLRDVLTEASGNISKASEVSGINRVNFYKLLKRHAIEPASFR
jgi:Nif-specific regulatory protein